MDIKRSEALKRVVAVATGKQPADIVIRNVRYLDVFAGSFRSGDVAICEGRIVGAGGHYQGDLAIDGAGRYLVPGFIDAHVHLESSMLTPARYAQLVLPLGTTTVVWDPHEIANVYGVDGIHWALDASARLPLSVFVMLPSCVPATTPKMGLETSAHVIDVTKLLPLRHHSRVLGLGEMMNVPGLIYGDDDVIAKMVAFDGRIIDGHCPHLQREQIEACAAAGVKTDHETTSREEAYMKLQSGIAVWIREGSCAQNSDELLPLINPRSAGRLGFCTDDLNPLDIAERGHINFIIDKALKLGIAPEDVFKVASYSPAQIYGLKDRGAIAPGYIADMVLVAPNSGDDFKSGMRIEEVFKEGKSMANSLQQKKKKSSFQNQMTRNINIKSAGAIDFQIAAKDGDHRVRVIELQERQIVTASGEYTLTARGGNLMADVNRDLLKVAVLERYHNTGSHATGFVKGFGLKKGALAASISHDSHNVVVVGCDEKSMAMALQRLIALDGGIVVVGSPDEHYELALPIGGLMSDAPASEVIAAIKQLKQAAKNLGSTLAEPFLQMAFLALPVIPCLKITDKGLVDVSEFKVVSLFV